VELCQLGRTVRRGCGPPGPLSPQIGASKNLNAAARRRQQGGSITTNCLLRSLVAADRCHRPGVEFCTKSPLRHELNPHADRNIPAQRGRALRGGSSRCWRGVNGVASGQLSGQRPE